MADRQRRGDQTAASPRRERKCHARRVEPDPGGLKAGQTAWSPVTPVEPQNTLLSAVASERRRKTHEAFTDRRERKEHSAAVAATKTARGHSCPLPGDNRRLLPMPRSLCSRYCCGLRFTLSISFHGQPHQKRAGDRFGGNIIQAVDFYLRLRIHESGFVQNQREVRMPFPDVAIAPRPGPFRTRRHF